MFIRKDMEMTMFIERLIKKNKKEILNSSIANCIYNGKQICEYFGVSKSKYTTEEYMLKYWIGTKLPKIENVYKKINTLPDDMFLSVRNGTCIGTVADFKKLLNENVPILLSYELISKTAYIGAKIKILEKKGITTKYLNGGSTKSYFNSLINQIRATPTYSISELDCLVD